MKQKLKFFSGKKKRGAFFHRKRNIISHIPYSFSCKLSFLISHWLSSSIYFLILLIPHQPWNSPTKRVLINRSLEFSCIFHIWIKHSISNTAVPLYNILTDCEPRVCFRTNWINEVFKRLFILLFFAPSKINLFGSIKQFTPFPNLKRQLASLNKGLTLL